MTTYDQVLKMKMQLTPGAIIPMRKFDEAQWMKPPPWDQVSILVVQAVEKRVAEHFGIFGNELDLELKKVRQEEFVGDILLELKPVMQQMMKLMGQLLPPEDAFGVVGMNRFNLKPEELRHEYEISGTVDLRNLDSDWMKEKIPLAQQILATDTMGITDKAFVTRSIWEALDYSYADMAVKDQQPATVAEIQDEQKAIDAIIGSGQDQPLPKDSNYQLRLQTLMAKVQGIPQNPATTKIIQSNPDIMKVIENRAAFFQRQLQQMQNAQIGRMQVAETFTKQAPATQAQSPMLAGY
jgi:hypothetical protein